MNRTPPRGLLLAALPQTRGPVRRVDLNDTLCEALGDLDAALVRSGASTFRMDRLPSVRADPKRLRRLFRLLLSEALGAGRSKRPPRLVISSRRVCDDLVEIAVRDDGDAAGGAGRKRAFYMTLPRGRKT